MCAPAGSTTWKCPIKIGVISTRQTPLRTGQISRRLSLKARLDALGLPSYSKRPASRGFTWSAAKPVEPFDLGASVREGAGGIVRRRGASPATLKEGSGWRGAGVESSGHEPKLHTRNNVAPAVRGPAPA